jgi:hypothetical protein
MPNDLSFDDPFGTEALAHREPRPLMLAPSLLGEEPGLDAAPKHPGRPIEGPCPRCGRRVLRARDDQGHPLLLELATACFALGGSHADGVPRAVPSRAYAVHADHCHTKGDS